MSISRKSCKPNGCPSWLNSIICKSLLPPMLMLFPLSTNARIICNVMSVISGHCSIQDAETRSSSNHLHQWENHSSKQSHFRVCSYSYFRRENQFFVRRVSLGLRPWFSVSNERSSVQLAVRSEDPLVFWEYAAEHSLRVWFQITNDRGDIWRTTTAIFYSSFNSTLFYFWA